LRSPLLLRRALAGACGLGLALGLWQSAHDVPWHFEPGPSHTAWVERYGALRPLLAGVGTAQFVHDFGADAARHRLYRAQFEVAPCVLIDRPDVGRVPIASLHTKPLILDFHTGASLESALETLRAAARDAGSTLEIQRLPGQLALVRGS
jgi:hypothetical protein